MFLATPTYIYQKVVQYLHVDLQVAKPQHDEMWQRLAKQNSQKPQIDEMFQHFVSWLSQVSKRFWNQNVEIIIE